MKTFSIAIATLLLGVLSTAPLDAQLTISEQSLSDSSALGETVVMDAGGIGQRVAKQLYLQFSDTGSNLSLRTVRVNGSPEFSYEIKGVTGLPVAIRGELRLELFLFYAPQGPGPARATLELTVRQSDSDVLPTDSVYNVMLVGRVPSYSLSYALPGGMATGVAESGTIDFGHKPTDVSTEATLTLKNVGSAAGTIQGVQISGTNAYSLVAPPTFPNRIEPGRDINIQLAFRPGTTSAYRGELTVDQGESQSGYQLAGIGGDLLRFSVVRYAAGASTGRKTMVQSGNPIVFNKDASVVEVVGANIRQSAQLVDSIRLTGPFRLTTVPRLPIIVAPEESFTVRIEPAGAASGDLTGDLVIGDAIFPLMLDVPTLPVVRFSSAARTLRPGEQVSLGLSLARPYPIDIAGSLQLELDSLENPNDPALQWSSGGRQAAFSIPAGETAAVFAGAASMAEFQAASVAGEITVATRFTTDPWGIDITPATAPSVRYMVDVAALPEVQFSQAGGQLRAGQTMDLGLSLAAPYVDSIAGTLILSFVAADVEGASGPWAGGPRQLSFQIAAGTTAATFGGGNSMTQFSVPTVVGQLTVTAQFLTEDGGANITPDPAPELEFSVGIAELPEVRFSQASGQLRVGQTMDLGLSLAAPYADSIAGTLILSFAATDIEGASGPWAGGRRQLSFQIPAGTTAATFGGNNSMTQFSVPTVAGQLTVTAQFLTEDGGVNITPDPAPELEFNVGIAALPKVSFSQASGQLRAGQTIDLGLSLAAPYADSIAGTLILAFAAADIEWASGPWAVGRRQLSFQIAAGTTAATFGADHNDSTQFSAPTVAGLLTVTAQFLTEDGGVNITPDPAPEVEFELDIEELPEVRFSQSGGTVAAGEQVELKVSLGGRYETDIVGVLNLAFETRAFVNDPAIQWATGGRQAWFTVLAGSTEAIFTGNSTANAFQSGTVAGQIVVTAQFYSVPDGIANVRIEQATASSANITPDAIPELRFSLHEAAPLLKRAALGSTGQGGFSIQVTGYATNRSVDSLSFTFTAAGGASLGTTDFNVDVASSFETYFGSNQSAASGSQFTVTVAFSLDEGAFEDIRSVSITATNGIGTSNALTVNLN